MKKQHELERRVLAHLKKHGPIDWNILSVHFDPNHSGDIGAALQDLRQWNYIAVNKDAKTSITDFGLERLEKGEF